MIKRILKMVIGLSSGCLIFYYIEMFQLTLLDNYIYGVFICFGLFLTFFVNTLTESFPRLTKEGRKKRKKHKPSYNQNYQKSKPIKKKTKTKVLIKNKNNITKYNNDLTRGHVESMWEELNK